MRLRWQKIYRKILLLNNLWTVYFVILILVGIYWSLRQIIRSIHRISNGFTFPSFVFKTWHRLNRFPPVPDQKLVLYFFIRMFKEMLLFCLIYAKPRTISIHFTSNPAPEADDDQFPKITFSNSDLGYSRVRHRFRSGT